MKSEFLISNISTGKLNAMVKNAMAQTGITKPEEVVRKLNSGELQVSVVLPRWTEKEGRITFSVTPHESKEESIARLEGCRAF